MTRESLASWVFWPAAAIILDFVAFFVAMALYLGFSRFGSIVLERDGDQPQFSRFSRFALLFASPRPGMTGTAE